MLWGIQKYESHCLVIPTVEQWGYSSGKSKTWSQTLPITMAGTFYAVLATLIGSGNGNYDVVKTIVSDASTISFNIENVNTAGAGLKFLVIGG